MSTGTKRSFRCLRPQTQGLWMSTSRHSEVLDVCRYALHLLTIRNYTWQIVCIDISQTLHVSRLL
jgi:hypothetical protein